MKIEIGKVVGVWGVKGWIKIHSYTRERPEIGQYSPWLLGDLRVVDEQSSSGSYEVNECRSQGRGLVAKLKSIDSREAAEGLVGKAIFIDRSQLPELPANEYYWQDLIGLQVVSIDGSQIGRVKSMIETGANDVFVVEAAGDEAGDKKRPDVLIPYVDEVIVGIDIDQGCMKVDWDPAYLLD